MENKNNRKIAKPASRKKYIAPKWVSRCVHLIDEAMGNKMFFDGEIASPCNYRQLLNIARVALNDFALSKKDALKILKSFHNVLFEPGNQGAAGITVKELAKIIDDAARHSSIHPKGWRRRLEESLTDFKEGDYHIGIQRYLLKPSRTRPVAEVFVNEFYTLNGQKTLRFYAGQFFKWNGQCWTPFDAEEIKAEIHRFLTDDVAIEHVREARGYDASEVSYSHYPAGERNVRDVLSAVQGLVRLPKGTSPNSWIGEGESPCDPGNLIFGPTKVYDWKNHTFRCPNPGWFNLSCLPIDVDMRAPRPRRFQRFLKELFGDDHEAIECLEEYLGLLLTPITSLQKMLLLVGPKRSGKGTLVRLIAAILGQENISSPRTSDFASRFGLQDLIGKHLAVASDARFSGKDIQKAIEVMLNITGEDFITIDKKFKEPVTLRLMTRIMILSNEEPRLPDASGAIVSRFLALKLNNSFYGREDIDLEQKLRAELPGILKILVKALQRLMKRRHFVQPQSGQEILTEMSKLGNPIEAFVQERCEIGVGLQCLISILYAEWQKWCHENGLAPGPLNIFCRNLRSAFPALVRRDGGKENFYEGIDLRVRHKVMSRPETAPEKNLKTAEE